jgi:hypothetical protein
MPTLMNPMDVQRSQCCYQSAQTDTGKTYYSQEFGHYALLPSILFLRTRVEVQGISKNLVSRAYPLGPERPDYLTSEEFLKFTPTEDFMSLPGEIFRTEFRLVVTHEGWEYTVLERELGAHVDPLRKMLVTVRLPGCAWMLCCEN